MREIQFKPEHVELVDIIGQDTHLCTDESLRSLASQHSSTFVYDGRPIAFAGVVPDGETGIVWLLPTKYLADHYMYVTRSMLNYIKTLPELYGFDEFVTNGHKDAKVIRWLGFLGFTYNKERNIYHKVV